MKSLLLTSLLISSSFLFNGCDAEDAAKVVGVETSMVYFVNGNSSSVTAVVEDDSKTLSSGGQDAFNYTGSSNNVDVKYTISGQEQGKVRLDNGKTHIYVSSDCPQEYLTHKSSSSKRIQVVNVSGSSIQNGEYSVSIDGQNVVNVFDNLPNCEVTPAPVTSTKGLVVVTRHSDGNTWSATLSKDYSFDIVVLPNNVLRVVPLIGFSDIY